MTAMGEDTAAIEPNRSRSIRTIVGLTLVIALLAAIFGWSAWHESKSQRVEFGSVIFDVPKDWTVSNDFVDDPGCGHGDHIVHLHTRQRDKSSSPTSAVHLCPNIGNLDTTPTLSIDVSSTTTDITPPDVKHVRLHSLDGYVLTDTPSAVGDSYNRYAIVIPSQHIQFDFWGTEFSERDRIIHTIRLRAASE